MINNKIKRNSFLGRDLYIEIFNNKFCKYSGILFYGTEAGPITEENYLLK